MRDLEEVIKGLEVCVSREPGGDYICDKCPYEVDGNDCEINSIKDAITLLKEQPEIVRCKDCKYLIHLSWMDEKNCMKCYVCNKHTFTGMRKEEWFCADGERRDDDD